MADGRFAPRIAIRDLDRRRIPWAVGVYRLFHGAEVVYVGRSASGVYERILATIRSLRCRRVRVTA